MKKIEGLDYEVREEIAYVTLNRPEKLNAVSPEMYEGLRIAMITADRDPQVELIVLSATGDKNFCTGGDLAQGAEDWTTNIAERIAHAEGQFPYGAFERCSKLILTVVNGRAWATGLIMCTVSDLVLASENASFRVPEMLRGLPDPYIPVRLPQHIGLAKARWLMYTTEEIDAREAERIGLVGKVVPVDELDEALDDTIDRLRRTAPKARGLYKRMIRTALPPLPIDDHLIGMAAPEGLEGMRSFAERRPAAWDRSRSAEERRAAGERS